MVSTKTKTATARNCTVTHIHETRFLRHRAHAPQSKNSLFNGRPNPPHRAQNRKARAQMRVTILTLVNKSLRTKPRCGAYEGGGSAYEHGFLLCALCRRGVAPHSIAPHSPPPIRTFEWRAVCVREWAGIEVAAWRRWCADGSGIGGLRWA